MDVLGLQSEVLAMSGGGLGQIVQAVKDDPCGDQLENVLIFGGKNDCKIENFPSNEQFAANIEVSLGKLAAHAQKFSNKSFCLVQQASVANDQNTTQHPAEAVRELYLAKRIKDLGEAVGNIQAVGVQYEEDETGHPTIKGTEQILHQLHEAKIMDTLIWNTNYVSTEKPYSRVEAIYRYGCNGCDNYGVGLIQTEHANQLICDACFNLFPTEPNELLQEIELKVLELARIDQDNNFPAMET